MVNILDGVEERSGVEEFGGVRTIGGCGLVDGEFAGGFGGLGLGLLDLRGQCLSVGALALLVVVLDESECLAEGLDQLILLAGGFACLDAVLGGFVACGLELRVVGL